MAMRPASCARRDLMQSGDQLVGADLFLGRAE